MNSTHGRIRIRILIQKKDTRKVLRYKKQLEIPVAYLGSGCILEVILPNQSTPIEKLLMSQDFSAALANAETHPRLTRTPSLVPASFKSATDRKREEYGICKTGRPRPFESFFGIQ